MSATLERDTCTFATMDPYVTIVGPDVNFRSRTHKDGGKAPTWNEELEMVPKKDTDVLQVTVFHEGLSDSDVIGQCNIKVG